MESQRQVKIPKLASERECTACLACENVCPQSAIFHIVKADGHTYVCIDSGKCIGCLKCEKICNASRDCFGENNLYLSKIYAAWTESEFYRRNATSGGAFAALAEKILDSDGCVIGAELNGFSCKHAVIYDKANLNKLQGSKYMASSMEDVYQILRAELPKRDVLFAGLGCQCAGVISFLPEIKTKYKLYTVDLVCGGIPSKLLIDRFRDEYPEVTGIISYRTKDKYELRVKTINGEKALSEKSLPLHGFNCGLTNRYNCFNCQFAKAHRKTDLTIGDLWDYSIEPQEHEKGISMVIAHSPDGLKLIDHSCLKTREIDWEGALLHNKRTVCGHQNIYSPRKKLTYNYTHLSKQRFKKLYTVTMTLSDVDLFAFRAFRYINERVRSKMNEKYILKQLDQLEIQ